MKAFGKTSTQQTIEEQLLGLARLIKTQQLSIEDVDSRHGATCVGITARLRTMEQLLQQQYLGAAQAELPAVKALVSGAVLPCLMST
jgi:ATP-dependent helicase/DNAse subunit B